MAFRIIWTQTASNDLQAIVRYIAPHDAEAARRMAERMVERIEQAAAFPLAGRVVPEKHDDNIREWLVNPYRIVYTVDDANSAIFVTRIWHASRGVPELD